MAVSSSAFGVSSEAGRLNASASIASATTFKQRKTACGDIGHGAPSVAFHTCTQCMVTHVEQTVYVAPRSREGGVGRAPRRRRLGRLPLGPVAGDGHTVRHLRIAMLLSSIIKWGLQECASVDGGPTIWIAPASPCIRPVTPTLSTRESHHCFLSIDIGRCMRPGRLSDLGTQAGRCS